MSVTLAPQMPQFVSNLCSIPAFMALSASIEGLFYSNLRGFNEETPRIVKWMRENSVAYIHEIQTVFNVTHTCGNLYSAYTLIKRIYTPVDQVANIRMDAALLIAGSVYCLFLISILNVGEGKVNEQLNEFTKKEHKNQQQILTNGVLKTKLILDFASFIIKENKFVYAFGMIASGYSLLRNNQLEWKSYSRVFYNPNNGFQNKIRFTYKVLQLNAFTHLTGIPKKCMIADCSNENKEPDLQFCVRHVSHSECIDTFIEKTSIGFSSLESIHRMEVQHIKDGTYTHSTYNYQISMLEKKLPHCPECDLPPRHNDLKITVFDQELNGDYKVTNTLLNKKPRPESENLIEALYTAYNVVQVGLAYLQSYPELTGTIYKIQEMMLVSDCFGLYFSYQSLLEKIKKKYGIEEKNNMMFYAAAVISGAALTALSYFTVMGLDAFLKPSFDLKNVMEKMNISPDFLKDIEVSWGAPLSKQIMQTVLVNRIAVNLGLAYFSENKNANLISVFAQCATLFKISNLRWIKLNRIVYIAQLGYSNIQSMFMVDSVCAKNKAHLQASLKVIHGYLSKLLDGSRFEEWFEEKNGFRTYFWKAILKSPTLASYEPQLRKLWMETTSKRVEIVMQSK